MITRHKREGNHRSDTAANICTRSIEQAVPELARFYGDREQQYIDLGRKLVQIIVEVMQEVSKHTSSSAELADASSQQDSSSNRTVPDQLPQPQPHVCTQVNWYPIKKSHDVQR